MDQPSTPPQAPGEAHRLAQKTAAKNRRLCLAYQEVFGRNNQTRSTSMRLVWEDLTDRACLEQAIFQPVAGGPMLDPIAAAHRDGARTLLLGIRRQLRLALKADANEEKPKRRIIR